MQKCRNFALFPEHRIFHSVIPADLQEFRNSRPFPEKSLQICRNFDQKCSANSQVTSIDPHLIFAVFVTAYVAFGFPDTHFSFHNAAQCSFENRSFQVTHLFFLHQR